MIRELKQDFTSISEASLPPWGSFTFCFRTYSTGFLFFCLPLFACCVRAFPTINCIHPTYTTSTYSEVILFDFLLLFNLSFKLDGVAPLIIDPTLTSFTTLSEKKKKKKQNNLSDTWHLTCDMWQVSCATCDSSLSLTVWEWRSFENIFTKYDLIN